MSTDQVLDFLLTKELEEQESSLFITKRSRGTKGRTIPTSVRKEVLVRSNRVCEFPNCDEFRNLEFEHVIPFAKGGKHEVENILLYCRAHNQRSAIKEFGQKKISPFLR